MKDDIKFNKKYHKALWGRIAEIEQNLDRLKKREEKEVKLKEEWIKDKIMELFVIFNILKPSSNDIDNADTFIRSIIRDARFLC